MSPSEPTGSEPIERESHPERATALERFFAACEAGDESAIRDFLHGDPALMREGNTDGRTGLHLAVRHPEVVRLLLDHGADPNVRDRGDNALPLHFAAGGGPIESVRALLDAGSDVHGLGDLHGMDVIGWATCIAEVRRDVVDLLVERGARHHVFSAIAIGDLDLLRRVVEEDPAAIGRRLSEFEQEQTALHFVVAPADGLAGGLFRTGAHYRALARLIELGADIEAADARGRTALDVAILRGDRDAIRILHAAGAKVPEPEAAPPAESPAAIAASIGKLSPMLGVPDMEATVAWYTSIGFELLGRNPHVGPMDWAMVRFGDAEIMFAPASDPWRGPTSALGLWIRTDRLDDLHTLLRWRQLERARAELAGETPQGPAIPFTGDLHTTFYGQREFSIRDPNGIELNFFQPLE